MMTVVSATLQWLFTLKNVRVSVQYSLEKCYFRVLCYIINQEQKIIPQRKSPLLLANLCHVLWKWTLLKGWNDSSGLTALPTRVIIFFKPHAQQKGHFTLQSEMYGNSSNQWGTKLQNHSCLVFPGMWIWNGVLVSHSQTVWFVEM